MHLLIACSCKSWQSTDYDDTRQHTFDNNKKKKWIHFIYIFGLDGARALWLYMYTIQISSEHHCA